jgi:hypothetical protein
MESRSRERPSIVSPWPVRCDRATLSAGLCRIAPILGALAFWFCASAEPARAACPAVNDRVAAAQSALRAAEPAHDATALDFERRLALIQNAYDEDANAETIRTTTADGCGDIQQVYSIVMTHAWADLLFAYLEPSLDSYIADPSCRFISRLHTASMLLEADETMNRSLISWNPSDARVAATRDHITNLVDGAATYLKIPLPPAEKAEDFARQDKFGWDVAKSRAPIDCAASVAEPNVPKAMLSAIFTPAS